MKFESFRDSKGFWFVAGLIPVVLAAGCSTGAVDDRSQARRDRNAGSGPVEDSAGDQTSADQGGSQEDDPSSNPDPTANANDDSDGQTDNESPSPGDDGANNNVDPSTPRGQVLGQIPALQPRLWRSVWRRPQRWSQPQPCRRLTQRPAPGVMATTGSGWVNSQP